jgi:hypothetical protein
VTADGYEVTERLRSGPAAITPEAAVAELRRETLVPGLDHSLVETLVGQLSKRVVVHRATPFSVSTTFPVFCPVSTYLVASTTSSSGYVRSITGRYLPASISPLT